MVVSSLEMDTYREWLKRSNMEGFIGDGIDKYNYAKKTVQYAFIRADVALRNLGIAMRSVSER